MHTFAQKPKATQQTTPAKSTMPGRHFGQSPEVRSILHLQRTIGNQAVQRMLRTDAEEPEADLTRPASLRFGHVFSRIPIHPPAAGAIQTKLEINQPGDVYEQEADYVSEQVLRVPEPQLQRVCACGNNTTAGGECSECRKKRLGLQAKLKVNEPGDIYEREADRIADQVMATPAHSAVSGPPRIQRFAGKATRAGSCSARQCRSGPCQSRQAVRSGVTAGHGAAFWLWFFKGAGAFGHGC